MKQFLKKIIGERHPLILFYHRAKAILAGIYYGNPSRKIRVIGVTGTDGKTTTVNLIARLLEEAGFKVGFTSTLRYQIGDQVWSNRDKMTTQSPFFVQKMLKQMVKEKCHYAIIEVTSHAVSQSRIFGINFDVAVLTNLTGDHIEYHGSFENYMRTKGKFFASIFSMRRKKNTQKVVVLNGDDPNIDYFNQYKGDQKLIYGLQNGEVRAEDILLQSGSTSFNLIVANGSQKIDMELLGEFNVYNALAAISVAISQGIALPAIAHAFTKIKSIGGRYESINAGQDFSVVVDYAHTPDALTKLCNVFKGLTRGRLILVFGCTGGGRDKSKRPVMGKIADQYADEIILTDDDPYLEDRWQILNDIAVGIKRTEPHGLHKIVDRTEAIRFALNIAKTNDTVLIAGKGGEEVIVIGNEKIPYDDREVVRNILGLEK